MLIFYFILYLKSFLSLHISHAEDKEDRYWYRYSVTSVWGTLIRGYDKPRRRGGSILSNFVFIQKDRSLFWVGIFTQPVNLVPGISHTVRYTNSGNQTGEPAWSSVIVLILFDPKQRAPCWVFTTGLLRIWIRFWGKSLLILRVQVLKTFATGAQLKQPLYVCIGQWFGWEIHFPLLSTA